MCRDLIMSFFLNKKKIHLVILVKIGECFNVPFGSVKLLKVTWFDYSASHRITKYTNEMHDI